MITRILSRIWSEAISKIWNDATTIIKQEIGWYQTRRFLRRRALRWL